MKGSRAIDFGLLLGLALAALFTSAASAQSSGGGTGGNGLGGNGLGGNGMSGGGQGRSRQQPGINNREPVPDQSVSPRTTDPEAYDAIDLYSRLCVSTRGNRDRAAVIVGDGDTAIEKMDAPLLRGMENGQSGGVGWIIRMPLGDKILLEYPPDGTCIVRAPRVNAAQMEIAFRNLLEQFSASGQFDVHRLADQTKTIDQPEKAETHRDEPKDEQSGPPAKLKFHILAYSMTLPDLGKAAQLVLATTDSKSTSIQATISFAVPTESTDNARR
jgi:hypothetical protein